MESCKLCNNSNKIQERGLCKECSIYSDEQVLKQNLLDEIQDMENNIKYKEEAFLRKYGWDYSCNFPDCCWRFVKEVKGETIAVSMSDAISIEKEILHYQE